MTLHHRRPTPVDDCVVLTPSSAMLCTETSGAPLSDGLPGAISLPSKGICGAKASCDDSSTASETISASFCLPGPPEPVVTALRAHSQEKGQALLSALQELCSLLQPGSQFTADLHKQVKDKLQSLHMAVVHLDVTLDTMEQPAGTLYLEEVRHWLEELQGYILHLTRSLDALAAGSCMSSSSSSGSLDSEQLEQAHSRPSAESGWVLLCADAYEALSKALEQLVGQSSQQAAGEMLVGAPLLHKRSRLVYQVARLPYNTYWAKKVAI